MFAMNLPTLVVCIVALAVIFTKWKQTPSGSLWAFLGFGLALILCFTAPAMQAIVQLWAMQGGDVGQRLHLLSGLSILWSLLRAATFVFLLVAVFAGRSTLDVRTAPPLS